jgi:hypothetical protein
VPIVTSKLPPDAIDAVRTTLSATGRFPRRRGGALSLSSPHPIFTVALERLASGDQPLDAAELVGWRALLEENERVVAAVELPGEDPGAAGALVNRGAFVQSTVVALTTAERHERVASERLELRLLRVNALYLLALWLHPADGDGDLFLPLAPAPAPFRAGVPYERTAFETELSEMARSVRASYEGAERPDELGFVRGTQSYWRGILTGRCRGTISAP